MVDQTTLPLTCHSFVGLDRQISSSPPACRSFTSLQDGPHTCPAEAGLAQYASYTTKCPATTESGLSGKQATHDGVHALPPVGKGPAHFGDVCQTRGMAQHVQVTCQLHTVSRHCHPRMPATRQSVQALREQKTQPKRNHASNAKRSRDRAQRPIRCSVNPHHGFQCKNELMHI